MSKRNNARRRTLRRLAREVLVDGEKTHLEGEHLCLLKREMFIPVGSIYVKRSAFAYETLDNFSRIRCGMTRLRSTALAQLGKELLETRRIKWLYP